MRSGSVNVDRRSFVLAATAGAFAFGLRIPGAVAQPVPATAAGMPGEVGIWAVVHPDDAVVIRVAKSEMGQGTALRRTGMRVVGHRYVGIVLNQGRKLVKKAPREAGCSLRLW